VWWDRSVHDLDQFGVVVGVVGVAVTLAVLSNRLSSLLRIPAPAFFLAGAAVVAHRVPAVPIGAVRQVVSVALVVLLFDGGMRIGRRRLRSAVGAVLWLGTVGTFVTAGAIAVAGHVLFGLSWLAAMLVGTALAPTDPAVVFSVLGKREVLGRSGVLLEGESGANDPVGIALMAGLVAASPGAASVAGVFALQMAVGVVVGVAGGQALLVFMRQVALPAEGLYPIRALAGAAVVFGVATAAHGSGYLAVFVAGILIGDEAAPFKPEITRFHDALASLAEIVAFTVLGLTVPPLSDAWLAGLALAALLAFVVRPLLVGLLLLPVGLTRGERAFVLWAGLKGAVPLLLGTFILTADVADPARLYGIVVVAVAFSVVVQGGLVPAVAARAGVETRLIEPREDR
jgi:potassium/hydrogen antiporter